jgi:pyruvate dehydrogenase E2 component (dihydrolipoamide acetyltransferase)
MAADERIPIRGLRKKIAEKMVQSAFTAPHFTYVEEVDMTELVRVREGLKAEAEARGVKLTYLPFVIKALILAFRRYPHLNAHMDDAKQELVVRGTCNIGIATATDSGLIVPVVKGCESRSMLSIASEITRISAAARAGKSVLEDLQGSSFTITNLGAMGGLLATPIINYPEVAILGIHKMRRIPMLLDDETMVARDVMNVSLSFDHRVIDGHVGALFTQELKKSLENPGLLYLDLV